MYHHLNFRIIFDKFRICKYQNSHRGEGEIPQQQHSRYEESVSDRLCKFSLLDSGSGKMYGFFNLRSSDFSALDSTKFVESKFCKFSGTIGIATTMKGD